MKAVKTTVLPSPADP